MLLFDGERLNELYATGFVIKMFIKFYTFFFFSSRRRHTRSLRDWSSDVCSSDLSVKRGIRPVSSDSPRRGSRCRCDFRSGEGAWFLLLSSPPERSESTETLDSRTIERRCPRGNGPAAFPSRT